MKIKRFFLISLVWFAISMGLRAQNKDMVINEIMAANVDYVLDPSFNYGSWIELYNPTDRTVNFNKLYVTDDESDLRKQPVRSWKGSLAKGAYFVIWFDHHDGVFSPDNIDFKLDYEGGTIYVTDGTKVICRQEYPKALGRISYARKTNGGNTWAWTDKATPGKSNTTSTFVDSADKQLKAPTFDADGCLYKNAFTVNIASDEGATIYYTINNNGDCPTPAPGAPNVKKAQGCESIMVSNKNFIIRARAYKDGYLPSEVTTRSYIYKNKNYVMPVISVATSKANLHSSEYGIFEGGSGGWGGWWGWDQQETNPNGRPGNGQSAKCNWNMDWDRPVNFEFISAKGEYAINQEVDMSTCGGWSRAWTPHSFKLKAGKYYMGQNSMNYQFFDDKPNIKHKALQIRNGGNDTNCRVKDAAFQAIVRTSGLRINTQSWQPVHVFINGDYHGTINMREPNNKHFAFSNYGYDSDDLDQFEISPDSCYVQKCGTKDKFKEWYELSKSADKDESYEKICNMVDIDEYINYMAVELYAGMEDWANNNVKGFRLRKDGKFHFVLFDCDTAGKLSDPFTTFANKKNFTNPNQIYGIEGVTPWKTGQTNKCENEFVAIFINMLKNESFRQRFTSTYCIVAGSVFTPSRVKTEVNKVKAIMNKALAVENKTCDASANEIINAFTSSRQTSMLSKLKSYKPAGITNAAATIVRVKSNIDEAEIFLNDVKVPTGIMDGGMYKPIKARAAAPAGYRFDGWYRTSDNELVSSDPEFEIIMSGNRYEARWTEMTQEEMIANNINTSPIVINEVSASNSIYINELYKKADWIELYNTSDNEINIAGMYLTDNIDKPQKYQIPADDATLNTIIPAHGHKIVWCDKKESNGANLHADFKLEADKGAVALFMYDGEDVVYSDTVEYAYHDEYHSQGRYPDGGAFGYFMPKPTPGSKNSCDTDVISFIQTQPIVTDIKDIQLAQNSDISIAHVGQGILNIKSANSNIGSIRIYSSAGEMLLESHANKTFATIDVSNLPNGIYIVKAGGKVMKFRK